MGRGNGEGTGFGTGWLTRNRINLKSELSQEIEEAKLGNAAADCKDGVASRFGRGELGSGGGEVVGNQIIFPFPQLDLLTVEEGFGVIEAGQGCAIEGAFGIQVLEGHSDLIHSGGNIGVGPQGDRQVG